MHFSKICMRYILIFLIVFIFNIPIINVIITSFKTNAELISPSFLLFFKPTLEHYASIFSGTTFDFTLFLFNSIIVAFLTSFITLLLTVPAAYGITVHSIGSKFILPFISSLRIIPLVIFAIPIFILYSNFGLIDTRIGLVIVYLLFEIPLTLILVVVFMQDVPKETIEAARIDGASEYSILLRIVVPMMFPSLVAVLVLSFLYSWGEFLFALLLTIKNATTLPVGATLFITAFQIEWGNIAAVVVLSILPPVILSFYLRKYMIEAYSGASKE